ncbi:hypothetical protein O181_058396 [Austropuccinia psidii MF-1]|uniref:Uncharacterized protein n=1 Tax=Austropuccinia psidii MF-1 TaxID=1389203 RepID=A0A9Q3HUT6_9BASI|nr:hypothetical protein [Austropuccinia psidii MF-1]
MSSVTPSQKTVLSDENATQASLGESCNTSTNIKQSWVWIYFHQGEEGFVECQVLDQFVKPCKKKLKRDCTGSTKAMNHHLTGFHQLQNPSKQLFLGGGTLEKHIHSSHPKRV